MKIMGIDVAQTESTLIAVLDLVAATTTRAGRLFRDEGLVGVLFWSFGGERVWLDKVG